MVAHRETLSAHSVRPRKMRGWIVPVREICCKQTVFLVDFLPGFVSLVIFSDFCNNNNISRRIDYYPQLIYSPVQLKICNR